jgi:hypothetical protein
MRYRNSAAGRNYYYYYVILNACFAASSNGFGYWLPLTGKLMHANAPCPDSSVQKKADGWFNALPYDMHTCLL